MFDSGDKKLLSKASKLTQDVGRRIGSPKNDSNDLKILAETLVHLANTLLTVHNTVETRSS